MSITNEQIEHIAKLSKLKFSDKEKETFNKEFNDILLYIEQLQEVDVEGVEPMVGASQVVSVMRVDEVTHENGESVRGTFVKLAPEHTDEYVETISPFQDNRK